MRFKTGLEQPLLCLFLCQKGRINHIPHPQRRNVITSMFGLQNGHIRKNLTQNGEPQKYNWGTQKKKKKKKKKYIPYSIYTYDTVSSTGFLE